MPHFKPLDKLNAEAKISVNKDLPNTNDIDEIWADFHQVMSVDSSEPSYDTLLVLIRALLGLPSSNADFEHCFSVIQKIYSVELSHMERSMVASLLTLKINVEDHHLSFKSSVEMLSGNKSDLRQYNEVQAHPRFTMLLECKRNIIK